MIKRWTALWLVCVMFLSSVFVSHAEPVTYKIHDPELLSVLEETVENKLRKQLGNNAEVESVSAIYVSKEYLEELEYNSRANIFFGYTMEELNDLFEGDKYVFALGDDGQTTVRKAETEEGLSADMLKKIAIGAGIILITVVVVVFVGQVAVPVIAEFAASIPAGQGIGAGALAFPLTQGVEKIIEVVTPVLEEEFGAGLEEMPRMVFRMIVRKVFQRAYQEIVHKLGLDDENIALGGIGGIVSDAILLSAEPST